MMDPWSQIASLSKSEIRRIQDQKLFRFINQTLYPFSPYYKEFFDQNKIDPRQIRTVDDLRNIPFTSKSNFFSVSDQSERFKDFVLQPTKDKIKKAWPASRLLTLGLKKLLYGAAKLEYDLNKEFGPVFMTFTTGTTKQPVPFIYSNYDILNLHTSGARMLNLFDIKQNDRVVNMFPYAPHLAFWQVVYGGLEANTLILSTGGGKTIGTEGNIRALLKMKPAVLLGVPSYVYHVFRTAKEQGCRLDFIKKVVLGASRVTTTFKKKLTELLESMGASNVSVFGTYGFTEARCAWAECPTTLDNSSGYHLYPDKEIIEIVDPETGQVKGEGEDGEIVYTSLDSRASSVIRYRTGDYVKGGVTLEPCPHCKRQVPRLSSDITRLSNIKDLQLSKIKGSLVNLNNFDAVLSDIPLIKEWQIEIKKRNGDPFDVDELVVYACVKECDKEKLKSTIKEQMLVSTEVTPNDIQFVGMKEIVKRLELETANKERRVLDSRPKDE